MASSEALTGTPLWQCQPWWSGGCLFCQTKWDAAIYLGGGSGRLSEVIRGAQGGSGGFRVTGGAQCRSGTLRGAQERSGRLRVAQGRSGALRTAQGAQGYSGRLRGAQGGAWGLVGGSRGQESWSSPPGEHPANPNWDLANIWLIILANPFMEGNQTKMN